MKHQRNSNHGHKWELANYRNYRLEVKSLHPVGNLINDQYNRHQSKDRPNIHCNKSLKNRPEHNNVSQENGDIKHRILTFGACKQNQFVCFIVVNDRVKSSHDHDVAQEEKARIEGVIVDFSCVSEVRQLNVKAENDFHHCSDDED